MTRLTQTDETTGLMDTHHRRLTYLRVSVTDRCNLRCSYCMPAGVVPKLAHDEILTYEEILRVIRAAARLGVKKVRITGGEPLVRRGIIPFLSSVTAVPGLEDVSLTTNGVLLPENVPAIRAAGIRRINVSLDTLSPSLYREIAGMDAFDRVWQGIMAALDAGLSPVKVNVVVLKGVNDAELADFGRLTLKYPLHVRFIERMPIGASHPDQNGVMLAPEIHDALSVLGDLQPVHRDRLDGPAERYRLPGAPGEIGLIRPISRHFCEQCNRLRLTASGALRTCLLSDAVTDIKGALRSGAGDAEIEKVLIAAARTKPAAHHLAEPGDAVRSCMSSIGG